MDIKNSVKSYFDNNNSSNSNNSNNSNNSSSSDNSFSENDFKKICSWLLLVTPNELLIISTILSLIIAKNYTIDEQNVLGTFFNCLGNNLQLIAAQRQLGETAKTEYQNLTSIKNQSNNSNSNNNNNISKKVDQISNDVNLLNDKMKKVEKIFDLK